MDHGNRRSPGGDRAPLTGPGSPPPGDGGPRAASSGARGSTLRRFLRDHRYLILLVLMVLGMTMESVSGRPVWVSAGAELFLGFSLLVMVLIVFEDRRGRLFALWAWVAATALGWGVYIVPLGVDGWPKGLRLLLLALLHGWAALLILRDIFQQQRISQDAVFGAATGYLLAAGGWANLYSLCEMLAPGSFDVSAKLVELYQDPLTRNAVFFYFSLVTITTIGFGDITPVRGPVAMFVMMEVVFGQFYIAVVVAQLVGMHMAQGSGRRQGRPRVPGARRARGSGPSGRAD